MPSTPTYTRLIFPSLPSWKKVNKKVFKWVDLRCCLAEIFVNGCKQAKMIKKKREGKKIKQKQLASGIKIIKQLWRVQKGF